MDISRRIVMFREGELVPRFPSQPSLSSANRWNGIKVERHRLKLNEELVGNICDNQICFNLGAPTSVTWKKGGQPNTKLIQPGHFSIAPHGQLRNVRWTDTMDLLLVSITPKLLQGFSVEASGSRMPELIEHYGHSDRQVQNLLHLLLLDLVSGSPAGSLYGEQIGTALAVYLAQCFSVKRPRMPPCQSELPGLVLSRALNFIDACLAESMSLQDIASAAGMSRFYFARLFRNSMGQSPSRYVTEQRIERAKYLLTRTTLKLDEISSRTGFSSQSHLSAMFRKLTGSTPSKFRLLASSSQLSRPANNHTHSPDSISGSAIPAALIPSTLTCSEPTIQST